jgi:hypothetical protein
MSGVKVEILLQASWFVPKSMSGERAVSLADRLPRLAGLVGQI